MAIDLFGLDAEDVRRRFPEVYQHIKLEVKEKIVIRNGKEEKIGRDWNNREYRRVNWWLFGENNPDFRRSLKGLPRYIVTVTTAKHRVFQFLDASILPDDALVCVALNDAYNLGVLSSSIHATWVRANASSIGVYKGDVRYRKTRTFDPFPFPDASDVLKVQIRGAAEELDALRKQTQADHPGLTLTQIYNVLEKLRASEPLNEAEEAIKTNGLVLIVKELPDRLDSLVAEAYGWPADLSEDEVLSRLVTLNAERAAEEKRGVIRWLRAGLSDEARRHDGGRRVRARGRATRSTARHGGGQGSKAFVSIRRPGAHGGRLRGAHRPLDAQAIAKSFRQGARVEATIARVLASLARIGSVHTSDGRTFTLRRSA